MAGYAIFVAIEQLYKMTILVDQNVLGLIISTKIEDTDSLILQFLLKIESSVLGGHVPDDMTWS